MRWHLPLLLLFSLTTACGNSDNSDNRSTTQPTDNHVVRDRYRLRCPDVEPEFESATTSALFRVGEIYCGGVIEVTRENVSVRRLSFGIVNEFHSDMITLYTEDDSAGCTTCKLSYAGEMTAVSDEAEIIEFAGWATAEFDYEGNPQFDSATYDIKLWLEPFKPKKISIESHWMANDVVVNAPAQ